MGWEMKKGLIIAIVFLGPILFFQNCGKNSGFDPIGGNFQSLEDADPIARRGRHGSTDTGNVDIGYLIVTSRVVKTVATGLHNCGYVESVDKLQDFAMNDNLTFINAVSLTDFKTMSEFMTLWATQQVRENTQVANACEEVYTDITCAEVEELMNFLDLKDRFDEKQHFHMFFSESINPNCAKIIESLFTTE
jgi:hypothetical protein